jgi:hypothetical protein
MAEDDGAVVEEEPSDAARLAPEAEPPQLPPLRGFRQQVVALLATSDEPMRAREIVQAIVDRTPAPRWRGGLTLP